MKKYISFLLIFVFAAVFITSCGNSGNVGNFNVSLQSGESSKGDNPPSDITSGESDETTTDISGETTGQDVPVLPKDEKTVVKFVAAGDALIHSAIYREAEVFAAEKDGYSGNYYFQSMYSGIESFIKGADIAFVNHEAPIAGNSLGVAGYPNFNAPTESGDALVDIGFNVVNVANNHMLDSDYKGTGYKNTIDYWAKKDVLQIGGYKNTEDYNTPRVINVDGINIAFLAYTYSQKNNGVELGFNGNKLNSKTSEYVLPLINDSTILKHIENAKKKADLVFVSMHWGTENVFNPTSEQKRLAKLIADCGADVIIGHHSHTVQPVEWITGKNNNKTLCIYSLGNLISGMLSSKNMVGGIMSFDIVKENGKFTIENPIFNPTVCHYDIKNFSNKDPEGNPVRTGFKVYLMQDYTSEMALKHGTQNYGKFSLDTLKNYAKNTISSEFLPSYLK